jgi:hypothetical protein
MAKKPTKTERLATEAVEDRLKSIKNILKMNTPYPPISRKFHTGELVNYGAHPNTEIVEVFDNGRAYEIRCWGEYTRYSTVVYEERTSIVPWIHLLPLSAFENKMSFLQNLDIRLNYSSMMLDSLISTYYNDGGIDMNPEYQRDYVWSVEDQVCLIDSIFNNRGIGSYILCFNGYDKDTMYEILDGKQRCKAIIDYFEDKFAYKGVLYSELSQSDRNHFENIVYPRATVEKPTREQKIKIFIHVNTTGKHMSPEHLEKVKGMLK